MKRKFIKRCDLFFINLHAHFTYLRYFLPKKSLYNRSHVSYKNDNSSTNSALICHICRNKDCVPRQALLTAIHKFARVRYEVHNSNTLLLYYILPVVNLIINGVICTTYFCYMLKKTILLYK